MLIVLIFCAKFCSTILRNFSVYDRLQIVWPFWLYNIVFISNWFFLIHLYNDVINVYYKTMEYFLGQTNNYRGQHFYMYYRVWIPFLPILYLHSAQFPLSLAIYILLILFRLMSGLPKTVWRWGTKRPPPSISVLWYKLSYHYHIIIISLSYHFHIIMNPESLNSIDIEFAWFVHRKLRDMHLYTAIR